MFQGSFRAIRPQHPLARLLVGVVAVLVAAILVTVGLLAAVALAIGGALFVLVRALRSTPATPAPAAGPSKGAAEAAPGVIEGEFTVVAGTPDRNATAPSH
jgi:hypothetical protein